VLLAERDAEAAAPPVTAPPQSGAARDSGVGL
jgi:hypothetical protein